MLFWLLVSLLIGLVPGGIAKKKGRSFLAWWLYGVSLWIIAVPHSVLLQTNLTAPASLELTASNGQRPNKSARQRRRAWASALLALTVLLAVVTILTIVSSSSPERTISSAKGANNTAGSPDNNERLSELKEEQLDFSKAVFTKPGAVGCPISLFFTDNAERAPKKIIDMFYDKSSNRAEQAKALGCVELGEGSPIEASDLKNGMVGVRRAGSDDSNYFTLEDELTNHVPGQSEEEKIELSRPHIIVASTALPEEPDNVDNAAGLLLVNTPPREPIPVGQVRVQGLVDGFGALICPSPNRLAALYRPDRATLSQPGRGERPTELSVFPLAAKYGCSYLPPGTHMTSEGANSTGTLAVVTFDNKADGSTITGLTLPSMIARASSADLEGGIQSR